MPSWRVTARSLAATLRRHRRKSRFLAIAILVYVAVVVVVGGIDVMIGPVRFRSHETDWLLTVAALAALLDLTLSETAASRILGTLRDAQSRITSAAPAVGRWTVIVAVSMVSLWGIGRAVQFMPRETPGGDMALLELYTRQASTGTALVGPYSRFRWNHPGPAMFYLFRPLYQLSGGRFESLRVTALLFNVGCLIALLAIIRSRAGPMLLLPTAIAFIVYVLRVPDVLTSPWNPHLLLLPLALLFALCGAVLDGDVRFAAAVVGIASFLVQTHLSVTPTTGALTLAALVSLAIPIRGPVPAGHRSRWLHLALWVGLALWFLPLAEQVSSPTGNLSNIFSSFFDAPQPGPASREGAAAFFHMLSGFLLPEFQTAWGGLQLRSVNGPGLAIGLGLLVALPWAARRAVKVWSFVAILAWLLFGAAIVALWSVLRIQGDPFDQLVFWISIIGVLGCAVVVATVVAMLPLSRSPAARLSSAGWVAATALLVLILTLGYRQLLDPGRDQPTDPTSIRIRDGAASIAGFLQTEQLGRPVLRIAPSSWGDAAGIVLILAKSGTAVTVDREWEFMFGRPLGETGGEDAEIVLANPEMRKKVAAQNTYVVLADWPELTIFARKRPARPAVESAAVLAASTCCRG